MKKNLSSILEEIRIADKIGLMTHINGDGDAFGSLLGLSGILESLGKEVVVFSNEQHPFYMEYFKKELGYFPKNQFEKVDLMILLDLSVKKRLSCPDIYNLAKKNDSRVVVIDHHLDGDLFDSADIVWQDKESSSTSEMVFWLSDALGFKPNKIVAEALLYGIETDTNFLTNPNSINKKTYEAKATLLKLGASARRIRESLKNANSINNLNFLGEVVERAKMNSSGLVATYISQEDLLRHGVEPGASGAVAGFLDQAKNSKIVLVAEQRDSDFIKVSLRSNNSRANVSALASYFGGGGHEKAAGFEVRGVVKDFL